MRAGRTEQVSAGLTDGTISQAYDIVTVAADEARHPREKVLLVVSCNAAAEQRVECPARASGISASASSRRA